MPEAWHVVNPFKVTDHQAFVAAAESAGFYRLFQRNQAGFTFCIDPRRSHSERPDLEQLYPVLQAHLRGREFALVRIEHYEEVDQGRAGVALSDIHTRYEKVYRDRVEPAVYRDDSFDR